MTNIKKNTIRLKSSVGKVYINLNTLKYYTCPMYIKSEFEKDWVQVDAKNVKAFIEEQKAQQEAETIKAE